MEIKISDEIIDSNKILESNGFKVKMPFPKYYEGTIIFNNTTPAHANAIRRILLDELEIETLDTTEVVMDSDDKSIFIYILEIINRIKTLPPFEENDNYYLNVKSENQKDFIPVLSSNIMCGNKPANVEQNILICMLAPEKYLTIKNIKTKRGNGRTHARFSAVFSPVTYEELDVTYIKYLNSRGFIEQKYIRVLKSILPKNSDFNNLIISCKEGEQCINMRDSNYFKTLTPIYNIKEATEKCKNFKLTFKSVYPARGIALRAFSELIQLLSLAKEASIIEQGELTYFTYKGTITTGRILFDHIVKIADVIMDNCVYSRGTEFKLAIKHPDAKKIFAEAINTNINIIKSLLD